MAKSNIQTKRPAKQAVPQKTIIPVKYHDWIYVGLIFLAVIIFFAGAIFGHGFPVADNIANQSLQSFVKESEKNGVFPLWIPYVFSGMPSYASLLINGTRSWDFLAQLFFGITSFFGSVFSSDAARVSFFYIIYGIGMYFLMRIKNHPRFSSIFTSIAAVFSTSVIIWIMIGHNTKPVVFAMYPWIFIALEKLKVKFSLLWAALLAVFVHIMVEASHLQMIFYAVCAFAIYVIYELIAAFVKKEQPVKVLRAGLLLALAGGIAFLMSADRYFSTLEYTKYSTRGTAPLLHAKGQTQTEDGGNDYKYATNWSFSPSEMTTFFVPNFYGFGKLDYEGPLTGGQKTKLMTYWGQKPFEDAAPYMGIIVLIIAIFGAYMNWRNRFVMFLILLSLFSLLLSFGYTFPVLYNFFYYNVPMFNKFRAPSMALALLQFAVPILAGYGLTTLIGMKGRALDKKEKNALYGMLAFSGIFLLLSFAFGVFEDSYRSAMAASQTMQRYGQAAAGVMDFAWDSVLSDFRMTAIILALAMAAVFMFVRAKLSMGIFGAALIILLVFDLWRVGYRPMEVAESDPTESALYSYDYFNYIKQDKGIYRVADFVSESPNIAAYHHLENVNGYHSAKLRNYQDMLDFTSNGSTSEVGSPFMWNMLNVKYIIMPEAQWGQPAFSSQQRKAVVYENPTFMERAFFVDTVKKAQAKEILNKMKEGSFNPKTTAYIEKDLPSQVVPADSGANAKVTRHQNHLVEIEAEAKGGSNLLFISEVYYPAGWNATLDGKPVEIQKVNYLFRGIVVPEGKHKIVMKFESPSFEKGKTLSLALNIVLALTLVAGVFLYFRNKKNKPGNIEE